MYLTAAGRTCKIKFLYNSTESTESTAQQWNVAHETHGFRTVLGVAARNNKILGDDRGSFGGRHVCQFLALESASR